jgi:hypothetical protein
VAFDVVEHFVNDGTNVVCTFCGRRHHGAQIAVAEFRCPLIEFALLAHHRDQASCAVQCVGLVVCGDVRDTRLLGVCVRTAE